LSARIIELGTRISPFGDRVGELPFLGRSFAQLRDEEIAGAGIDPARLTFADYAIATAPVLSAFASHADGKPRALALPSSSACAHLVPVSSVRSEGDLLVYDIFIDVYGEDLAALRASAIPTRVDLAERTRRRELPRVGPPPHHLDLPADGKLAAHVEHWVHVLWTMPLLVPALIGRARAKRGNVVGKGAQIHPSAFLEGAVVGEGAIIGAGCSVRHSYVGKNASLADFTKLSYSSIGDTTHTLADASFSHVVALGGGTLTSFFVKDILLGTNVFLTSGVIFWSESIDGTIHVEHRGRAIDTKRKVLGGCAGHGCVLGARTIVAPGKALPNRITVVMRKEEGVQRIDPALDGTPACWYDASLVPVEHVFPGHVPDEL
jgi:carbonic anhydrase/acetyltransferase-like protein (isoleucine patch superfamily)